MRKFSKIVENKKFLEWSVERISSEFKTILNADEFDIDLMYVSKEKDGTSVWDMNIDKRENGVTDIEKYHATDSLFSPMFLILVSIGNTDNLESSNFHEVNGKQVDNWVHESIKFDIVENTFNKLSSFLHRYKDDFYISMEMGGHKWGKVERDGKTIGSFPNTLCKKYILSVVISLIMKDEFEYEQIM